MTMMMMGGGGGGGGGVVVVGWEEGNWENESSK